MKYRRIFYLFILIICVSCSRNKEQSVIAEVNGISVTSDELNQLVQQELFDELNRIYEIKKIALNQLIRNKLILIESQKKGIDKDIYINSYVENKIRLVGLDSLYSIYNIENSNPMFYADKVYYTSENTFEGNLEKREILKSCIIAELIDSLKTYSSVVSYLYPPKSPIFRLDDLHTYYRGDTSSSVTVSIISDFNCSECISAHKMYSEIYEEYKDRVRFCYINFSAATTLAQLACDAADAQNAFWNYHDSLYSHAGRIDSSTIYRIAQQLNLDLQVFKNDLEDPVRKEKLDESIHSLVAMGLYATPTVVINGRLIVNSNSKTEIVCLIEKELKQ